MGIFGRKNEGKLDTREFTKLAITEFQTVAQSFGVAERDLINVPELIVLGGKLIPVFLGDRLLRQMYPKEDGYYREILWRSLMAGISLAAQWHEDFSDPQEIYRDQLTTFAVTSQLGAQDPDAVRLLQTEFSEDLGMDGEKLVDALYAKAKKLLAQYKGREDFRSYSLATDMAALQTGISMMLARLGY